MKEVIIGQIDLLAHEDVDLVASDFDLASLLGVFGCAVGAREGQATGSDDGLEPDRPSSEADRAVRTLLGVAECSDTIMNVGIHGSRELVGRSDNDGAVSTSHGIFIFLWLQCTM